MKGATAMQLTAIPVPHAPVTRVMSPVLAVRAHLHASLSDICLMDSIPTNVAQARCTAAYSEVGIFCTITLGTKAVRR